MARTLVIAAVALTLALGECGKTPVPGSGVRNGHVGGTLRIVSGDQGENSALMTKKPHPNALDPQTDFEAEVFELLRCCLQRTLLSTNGHATSQGGAELHPDLATTLPTVSADGLQWTFSIRRGLHYGPPLTATEITSGDFVRALQREAKLGSPDDGGYSNYFSVIRGFDDYAKGAATSIAGVQTPDTHTLVCHLTKPTGDFAYRMSMPAMGPIPPSPGGAPFGAADGHDQGYGRFLVASGPYMVAGSEDLTLGKDAKPLTGLGDGVVKLVRNPSWKNDGLRPAYADMIVVSIVDDDDAAAKAVDDGSADLVMTAGPPVQAPLAQIRRYQNDPSLGRVEVDRRDLVRYITMNVAMPPFDDMNVRKALNFVVDKAALVRARGGALAGDVIGHIALDSSEQNLLVNYDPYRTPGNAGSLELAKNAMKASRYDHNHDGICDANECKNVKAYFYNKNPTFGSMAPIVRTSAAKIGIQLELHGSPSFFGDITPFESKIPLGLFPAWGKDYLNPANFFEPLFSSSGIGGNNWSFVGAKPEQLRKAGYRTTAVPSVDDRIDDCQSQIGRSQLECWTALDQYMMENVVPWVPFLAEDHIQIVPARIEVFAFDQFVCLPALEQISLKA